MSMNFKALSPEAHLYFKDVLGLSSVFLNKEMLKEKSILNEEIEKLVLLDEELSPKKQGLLNKILEAFDFQDAKIIYKEDFNKESPGTYALEAFFFGRHLESFKTKAKKSLVGPSLQDLLDEPSLKKLLWMEMKDYMKENRK